MAHNNWLVVVNEFVFFLNHTSTPLSNVWTSMPFHILKDHAYVATMNQGLSICEFMDEFWTIPTTNTTY